MNAFVKKNGQKWLGWAVRNPKKFFMYSMVFLSVSFIISIVQGVFFASDTTFKIKPPVIYTKSSATQNTLPNNDKEMKKIISELQLLKSKRDKQDLRKEDSLRIEYLFNQYQHLKNGH